MMLDKQGAHSIFNNDYEPTLKSILKFEFISFFGRIFSKYPKKLFSKNYLHLGSGHVIFDQWMNANFFKVKFWKLPSYYWTLDLRYPLKCEDNFWDGIFTEHTIEHLSHSENYQLFKEIHRTLKKDAWIRICIPGLDKNLELFSKPNLTSEELEFMSHFNTKADAIRSLTQHWGHRSVWDAELMILFLSEIGFRNVKNVNFMEGTDTFIIKDSTNRKVGSLYIEAQK